MKPKNRKTYERHLPFRRSHLRSAPLQIPLMLQRNLGKPSNANLRPLYRDGAAVTRTHCHPVNLRREGHLLAIQDQDRNNHHRLRLLADLILEHHLRALLLKRAQTRIVRLRIGSRHSAHRLPLHLDPLLQEVPVYTHPHLALSDHQHRIPPLTKPAQTIQNHTHRLKLRR